MGEPRKHHYVHKAYLAKFTPSGSIDDYLWILDQTQCKQYATKPVNAACERDFYRVYGNNIDPNMVEKSFSPIEAKATEVITEIEKTLALPQDEEFEELIFFVALMATRGPLFRKTIVGAMKELSSMTLRMMLDTEDKFYSVIENAKKEGYFNRGVDIDYEEMRDFVFDENRYEIKIPNEHFIISLLDGAKSIFPWLLKRKWSLLISKKPGVLICSDNPVSLVFKKRSQSLFGPGFGLPNTELTFPISKNIALFGQFEGDSTVSELDKGGIAALNSRTGMYSIRFIYSANDNFSWEMKNGKIGDIEDLKNAILLEN